MHEITRKKPALAMSALGHKQTFVLKKRHVPFGSNSDRESKSPKRVGPIIKLYFFEMVSALAQKAGTCAALANIC
jgi:hypothetical protein